MAKVPYIPIYIGDWEQDTNCLSLQAEAAWLKIIFKMHKDDKSGIYKTSTKSLQNLWKTDTKGVQEILSELIENNVCGLETGEQIIFTNRRMLREREISEVRSKSVQNRYKPSTKPLQNTDIDNDNDSENENGFENENFGKSENLLNGDAIIPTVCRNWYSKFSTYTKDQQEDFQAVGKIISFMARQHSIVNINDPEAREKIIATMDAIAEVVSNESFWINKPLKSIANNIQEFYNRIKNPIQNAKGKQQPNLAEEMQQRINKRFGSGQ